MIPLPEEGDEDQALEGLERVLHQGSMLLALQSEVAIALARYEMKGARKTVAKCGRRRTSVEKPCTESIVWSLSHLTVTRIVEKGVRKKALFSNWDPIS